jgi:hypothetical protein
VQWWSTVVLAGGKTAFNAGFHVALVTNCFLQAQIVNSLGFVWSVSVITVHLPIAVQKQPQAEGELSGRVGVSVCKALDSDPSTQNNTKQGLGGMPQEKSTFLASSKICV